LKGSDIYGDDLDVIGQYGAFDSPEGKKRLGKIAVITTADGIARRHLPLYPIRRWRKSLEDIGEATRLASGGGWLARRALAKCDRRLQAAEANLDGYLDKIIRKYELDEEWETFASRSEEDWAEIDRLMTSE